MKEEIALKNEGKVTTATFYEASEDDTGRKTRHRAYTFQIFHHICIASDMNEIAPVVGSRR